MPSDGFERLVMAVSESLPISVVLAIAMKILVTAHLADITTRRKCDWYPYTGRQYHPSLLLQDLFDIDIPVCSGSTLAWFGSYLPGWMEQVCIGASSSPTFSCNCGVPAGFERLLVL